MPHPPTSTTSEDPARAASPWFAATSPRAWLLAPLCCALAVGFYWIIDVPRSPMEGLDSPTAKPKPKSPKLFPIKGAGKQTAGAKPRPGKTARDKVEPERPASPSPAR